MHARHNVHHLMSDAICTTCCHIEIITGLHLCCWTQRVLKARSRPQRRRRACRRRRRGRLSSQRGRPLCQTPGSGRPAGRQRSSSPGAAAVLCGGRRCWRHRPEQNCRQCLRRPAAAGCQSHAMPRGWPRRCRSPARLLALRRAWPRCPGWACHVPRHGCLVCLHHEPRVWARGGALLSHANARRCCCCNLLQGGNQDGPAAALQPRAFRR